MSIATLTRIKQKSLNISTIQLAAISARGILSGQSIQRSCQIDPNLTKILEKWDKKETRGSCRSQIRRRLYPRRTSRCRRAPASHWGKVEDSEP